MEVTSETLAILVLLLPGFTATILLDLLVVRKPKDNLPKIVEALVLSFIVYALLAGVFRLSAYQRDADGQTAVNSVFVMAAAGAALVLPTVLAFLSTNDVHMKVFRFLRISTKTARDTTWLDVFTNHKQYVIVNLTGKRRVFGWPMYFSNDPEEGLLYLYDPAWVNEDGTYTELKIHGLFLLEKSAIESIEFLNLGEADVKPRAKGEVPGCLQLRRRDITHRQRQMCRNPHLLRRPLLRDRLPLCKISFCSSPRGVLVIYSPRRNPRA